MPVTQLTIAPTNAGLSCSTSVQVPHAPWLTTTGSYLKTLERLSGPTALSLLTRTTVLCNQVFNRLVSPEDCFRRGVDLFQVVTTTFALTLPVFTPDARGRNLIAEFANEIEGCYHVY